MLILFQTIQWSLETKGVYSIHVDTPQLVYNINSYCNLKFPFLQKRKI